MAVDGREEFEYTARRSSSLWVSTLHDSGKAMNLILLGAPGSGKGTQSARLLERYGLAHISTGDILRAAVRDMTPLGREADTYMKAGKLVPDEVVIGLVEERLGQPDAQRGFLLDGFPRTTAKADALGTLITRMGLKLDRVILLDVGTEELVTRLKGRGRADDTDEAVRTRLKIYEDQTQPLIQYYSDRGFLTRVEGSGEVDAITQRVLEALGA